jgi:hypothetical protein
MMAMLATNQHVFKDSIKPGSKTVTSEWGLSECGYRFLVIQQPRLTQEELKREYLIAATTQGFLAAHVCDTANEAGVD